MVDIQILRIFICFIIFDVAYTSISTGVTDVDNAVDDKIKNDTIKIPELKKVETRRAVKKKRHRSTSSSSGERGDKSSGSGESLSLTYDDSSSRSSGGGKKRKKDKDEPQSTEERHGWRKWHRKCTRCPEDMVLKWRDPRIKWICGAYQRARRSFKSLCMMHYRNCQDGTMFVKISDHRCQNDTDGMTLPHGDHFFYDYPVKLTDESSKTSGSTVESDESSSSLDD